MKQYPRISVRVSPDVKIKLQALAIQRGVKPSKLVQSCVSCLLNNPTCKALLGGKK